jgi:hydrogenase small subunit
MSINRRDFLRIMGGTSAALAFPSILLQGCKKALNDASKRTPVIWLQGQSCSGCSVSLLNELQYGIATVITEKISLNFHQTVMGGTGHVAVSVLEEAVKKNRKDFVLVLEGSIPTKDELYCTIGEVGGHHASLMMWVKELGKNAAAVVAVGSCSTGGGIPAAKSMATGENPTGAVSLSSILKDRKVICVPGCPPHPDWIVGTLLHLILKKDMKLDEQDRPVMYYGETVHDMCERLSDYRMGVFAKEWGDEGCLYNLGCLGMDSGCDIPKRKWLGGKNSCTQCGAGCIGCTERPFPDYGTRGIFKHMTASADEINKLHPSTREIIERLKTGGVING